MYFDLKKESNLPNLEKSHIFSKSIKITENYFIPNHQLEFMKSFKNPPEIVVVLISGNY